MNPSIPTWDVGINSFPRGNSLAFILGVRRLDQWLRHMLATWNVRAQVLTPATNSMFPLMQSEKQQMMAQVAGTLPSSQDDRMTWTDFLFPSFGLAQYSYCRHLENEPADGSSLSFSVSLLFKTNSLKKTHLQFSDSRREVF